MGVPYLDWMTKSVWTTKLRGDVKLSSMSTTHLLNILAFLERNIQQYYSDAYHSAIQYLGESPNSKMAQEHKLVDLDADPLQWLQNAPIYQAIRAEMQKRLNILKGNL